MQVKRIIQHESDRAYVRNVLQLMTPSIKDINEGELHCLTELICSKTTEKNIFVKEYAKIKEVSLAYVHVYLNTLKKKGYVLIKENTLTPAPLIKDMQNTTIVYEIKNTQL
jgi:hypothetical protein